jgi:hypothetical protein
VENQKLDIQHDALEARENDDLKTYPLWFALEDLAEKIPDEKRKEIVSEIMNNTEIKLLRDLGIKTKIRSK